MNDTILVIGGGIETIPGIEIAHKMGLRVLVSDINPEAPAFECADDHLVVSTYDINATFIAAHQYHHQVAPIKGVISIGTDVPLIVAQVAYRLGLSHIPIRTATICSNKMTMANVLGKAGAPIPETYAVCGPEDIPESGLWIIKPADSRGGRGVILLSEGVDKKWAYKEALSKSKLRQVIIQRFIHGPQLSTEGVVISGKYYHVASVDRNYSRLDEMWPYMIEDGGSQPSCLPKYQLDQIPDLMQQAANAIDLDNGTLKGDVVFHGNTGKPYIIEVAPRLSGGYMSTIQIPLATGVNIVEHAINLCMGKHPNLNDLKPKQVRAVAIRYEFPLGNLTRSHVERGKHVIATGDTVNDAVMKAIFELQPTGPVCA